MLVTANQVAAALRTFLPEVEGGKLHRLLYYVQGHQLAIFGRPAFAEDLLAGADGPRIEGFQDERRPHERGVVDEQILNVVMIVANRYGQLTTKDLSRLSTTEPPWRTAEPGAAITHQSLAAFFAGDGADELSDDLPDPDASDVLRMEAAARRHSTSAPVEPDDFDALMAEVTRRAIE